MAAPAAPAGDLHPGQVPTPVPTTNPGKEDDVRHPSKPPSEAAPPAEGEKHRFRGLWARLFPGLDLSNPGKFENINVESRTVLNPETFDGTQINISKPLNQGFALSHALGMGSAAAPPSYHFGANYATNTMMLMSRIDTKGALHARYHHMWTDSLSSKVVAQLMPDDDSLNTVVDVEYDGQDFSSQFKFGTNGIIGGSLLQSLTPKLAVGFEHVYLAPRNMSADTLAARYTTKDFVAHAAYSSMGQLSLSYVQKVTSQVNLATEFVYGLASNESIASVGYDFNLRSARVTGLVESTGRIAALLEERLAPGVSFLVSGEIHYPKNEYRFGFGFNMGQ